MDIAITGACGSPRAHRTQRLPRISNTRFPHIVAVAVANIVAGKAIPELKHSARITLAFIVRLTEASNATKSIWPHKATIATHTGLSEATVYRVLNELVELNIIIRLPQARKNMNGRLAGSHIQLTREACERLGLKAGDLPDEIALDPVSLHRSNVVHKSSELPPISTPESTVIHSPPTRKLIDGQCITKTSSYQQAQSQKKQPPRPAREIDLLKVPVDLRWLATEKAVSNAQIFMLMGLFKAKGQKLSHAVTATRKSLEALPRRSVFPYLLSLVSSPTDWGFQADRRALAEHVDGAAVASRSRTADLQRRLEGRLLTTPAGRGEYRVEGGFVACKVPGKAVRYSPFNEAFVSAVDAGRLVLLPE
jgi:hypothetical protein